MASNHRSVPDPNSYDYDIQRRDGDYLATCKLLDLSASGFTESQALEHAKERVRQYLDRGTWVTHHPRLINSRMYS